MIEYVSWLRPPSSNPDSMKFVMRSGQKSMKLLYLILFAVPPLERQAAAAKTAKEVEYMIVIGGYHSSNTQKLADICKAHCAKTCHIETIRDLDLTEVMKYQIGITAGASAPDWIVKEVLEGMEEQNKIAEKNVVVRVAT